MLKHDNWKQVRYVPSDLAGYNPQLDKLYGGEVYGEPEGDNTQAWAIRFDNLKYEYMKVTSEDKTYKQVYKKIDLVGKLD